MFGLGAIIRVFRKTVGGFQRADQLDATITSLESEYAKPVLATFNGVARYDAAERFLDATLLRRLQTQPSDVERRNIIRRYLDRFHEEYVMAKPDLAGTPATRAEVVALGVALREIALTLDDEIADFRARSAVVLDEQRASGTSTAALARQKVDEAVLRLSAEVRSSVERVERELQSNIESSFSRHTQNVSEQLAVSERDHIARLTVLSAEQGNRLAAQLADGLADGTRRIEGVAEECRRSINEHRQAIASTIEVHDRQLTMSINAIRTAQASAETEGRQRIDALAQAQATAFSMFKKSLTVDRCLIAATLAIAVIALFK
jgi:hypothetical protein